MNQQTEYQIHKWIDDVISGIENKEKILGYCFNLYEGMDEFHLQIIGSGKIPDEDNPDWACNEIFTSGENVYKISSSIIGEDWETALFNFKVAISKYILINNDKHGNIFKNGIGVGFVDGDLEIITI